MDSSSLWGVTDADVRGKFVVETEFPSPFCVDTTIISRDYSKLVSLVHDHIIVKS